MSESSNRVLFYGWLACPCTAIAQARFAKAKACFAEIVWEDPNAELMSYLQCVLNKPNDHSFVYFRKREDEASEGSAEAGAEDGTRWSFAGNGFQMAPKDLSDRALEAHLAEAQVARTCQHASVLTNVYGTPVEPCGDEEGPVNFASRDGSCIEQMGYVHQVCVERLPKSFLGHTKDPTGIGSPRGHRCVGIGPFAAYAQARVAANLTLRCRALPETIVSPGASARWHRWAGAPLHPGPGLAWLAQSCLDQAAGEDHRCAFRARLLLFLEAAHGRQWANAPGLSPLQDILGNVSCSGSPRRLSALQTDGGSLLAGEHAGAWQTCF